MARRTREEALETRERILDAAERVFQMKGVSRTSLNEVALEAGVTRGAIYWHFENKAALYEAMLSRVCEPMEGFCAGPSSLEGRDDPLGFVRNSAVSFLKRLASDGRYQQVLEIAWHKCEYVEEMAVIKDKHLEAGIRSLDTVEIAMRRARESGRIRGDVCPRQAAVGLLALIDGLVVNWSLDHRLFPLADMAEGTIDTYLAGLGGACPDRREA